MIKKALVTGLALIIAGCSTTTPMATKVPTPEYSTFSEVPYRTPRPEPTATSIPTITPEPWYTATPRPMPTTEPSEKKLLTFSFMLGEELNLVGFVYDTNNNNVPDLFEVYEIGLDPNGFFYIIDLYRIESDSNENQVTEDSEVLYQKWEE